MLILPRVLGLTGIQLVQTLSDLLTFVVSVPFHLWMGRRLSALTEAGTSA